MSEGSKVKHYYNEIDPYAAQWLKNLIAEGLIAPGDVDERSIAAVKPDDIRGYVQCHFFAGIGGWSYALRLAQWPDNRPVWTGSCPCQPFSVAGPQQGFDDPRHLWPEFRRLIAECRPTIVFGEQVAAAASWLGLVRSDLEAMGYAVGAIPMEAASAGAEHFRDRYWFVARDDFEQPSDRTSIDSENPPEVVAHTERVRLEKRLRQDRQSSGGEKIQSGVESGRTCNRSVVGASGLEWGEGWTEHEFRNRGLTAAVVASIDGCQYVECPDGKYRRLPPPRVRWLGTRVPSRVAKLRALGNAIDPRAAATFIIASNTK